MIIFIVFAEQYRIVLDMTRLRFAGVYTSEAAAQAKLRQMQTDYHQVEWSMIAVDVDSRQTEA